VQAASPVRLFLRDTVASTIRLLKSTSNCDCMGSLPCCNLRNASKPQYCCALPTKGKSKKNKKRFLMRHVGLRGSIIGILKSKNKECTTKPYIPAQGATFKRIRILSEKAWVLDWRKTIPPCLISKFSVSPAGSKQRFYAN